MIRPTFALFCIFAGSAALVADEPFTPPRCELIPLPDHQVSFQLDGVEKTRWRFGPESPRPFFYPFNGPSGVSLTRMGHPGAQNHDHHLSVWFAHYRVNDQDFWSNGEGTQVRQRMWYCYRDGDDEAIMASACDWYDQGGSRIMEQELVASLLPLADGEHALEIQLTVRPPENVETVELGKTNFGFLAVRVAKSVSVYFGGGKLTSSEGRQGEADIFGKRARWMDYSGPIAVGRGSDRKSVVEGITYFDHPDNPRYPAYWHVRKDGWMGASCCMQEGFTVTKREPLRLRYLLHAHTGGYSHSRATRMHADFAARPGFEVTKDTRKHRQFEVGRIAREP